MSDEELTPEKEIEELEKLEPLLVRIEKATEVIKEEDDAPEYWEQKATKEEIEEIEVE